MSASCSAATPSLKRPHASLEAGGSDGDNEHLTLVPWADVLHRLPLQSAVRLSATCRFMHGRVRGSLTDVDLLDSLGNSARHVAAAVAFLAQCNKLNVLRISAEQAFCVVRPAGAAPRVRVHRLLLMSPLKEPQLELQRCVVDLAHLREFVVDNVRTLTADLTSALFKECRALTHLTVGHFVPFPFGSLPPLPCLTHLRLTAKTGIKKWSAVWQRLPAIKSLWLCNENLPLEQLPPALHEFGATLPLRANPSDIANFVLQMAALQRSCPRIHTVKFSLTTEENATPALLGVLKRLQLQNLHNLVVELHSRVRDVSFAADDIARLRAAVTECRARASSLNFVEVGTVQRFQGPMKRHTLLQQ